MTQRGSSGKRPADWTAEEAFQLAEAIHNNQNAPKVKRQHVVSRTVLRNFTITGPRGSRIGRHDLVNGTTRDVSTADAAIEKDFMRIDSFVSEQIWSDTESLIPAAHTAAQSRAVLNQPDQLQVLRRAIALHFGRSITTLAVVEQTWPRVRDRIINDLLTKAHPHLVAMLTKREGHPPTESEVMAEMDTIAADGVEKVLASGAYARVRIEQFYDQALQRFARLGVEIVHVPTNDLVITDNPVLLQRPGDQRRAAMGRMAIDEAATIVFPLAPDLLISIGPRNGYGSANQQAVDEINRSQIAGAHRFVFHKPGQNISHLVSAYGSLL
jgi:hypothetical protein